MAWRGLLLLAVLVCVDGHELEPLPSLPALPEQDRSLALDFSVAKGGWVLEPHPEEALQAKQDSNQWSLGEENGQTTVERKPATPLPEDPFPLQSTLKPNAKACSEAVDRWRDRLPVFEEIELARNQLTRAQEGSTTFQQLQQLSDAVNTAQGDWDKSIEAELYMASKQECVRSSGVSWDVFMSSSSRDTSRLSKQACVAAQTGLTKKLSSLKRSTRNRMDETMSQVGAMEELSRREVQAWDARRVLGQVGAKMDGIQAKMSALKEQSAHQATAALQPGADKQYAVGVLRGLREQMSRLELQLEAAQDEERALLVRLTDVQEKASVQRKRVALRQSLDAELQRSLAPLRARLSVLRGVLDSSPEMRNKIAILEEVLSKAREQPWEQFHRQVQQEDSALRVKANAALARSIEENAVTLKKREAALVQLMTMKNKLEQQQGMLLFDKDVQQTARVLVKVGAQIARASALEQHEKVRQTELLAEARHRAEHSDLDTLASVQALDGKVSELDSLMGTIKRFVGVEPQARERLLQAVQASKNKLQARAARIRQKQSGGDDDFVLGGEQLQRVSPGVKRRLAGLQGLLGRFSCDQGVENVMQAALTVQGTQIEELLQVGHLEQLRAEQAHVEAAKEIHQAQARLQATGLRLGATEQRFEQLNQQFGNSTHQHQLLLLPHLLQTKFQEDQLHQKSRNQQVVQVSLSKEIAVDELWSRLGNKCSALTDKEPRRICCTQVMQGWRWEQPSYQLYSELEQQAHQAEANRTHSANKLWHAAKAQHQQWSQSGQAAAFDAVFSSCTKQAGYLPGFRRSAVSSDALIAPMSVANGQVVYDPSSHKAAPGAPTTAAVEYDVHVQKGVAYYLWATVKCTKPSITNEDGFTLTGSDGEEHVWGGLLQPSASGWQKAPVVFQFTRRQRFTIKLVPLGSPCQLAQIYFGSADSPADVAASPLFRAAGAADSEMLGESAQPEEQPPSVQQQGMTVPESAPVVDPKEHIRAELQRAVAAEEHINQLRHYLNTTLSDLTQHQHATVTAEQKDTVRAALSTLREKTLHVASAEVKQKHALHELQHAESQYVAAEKVRELKVQLERLLPQLSLKLPSEAHAIGSLAGLQRVAQVKALQREMDKKLAEVQSTWRLLPAGAKHKLEAFKAAMRGNTTSVIAKHANQTDNYTNGTEAEVESMEGQIEAEAEADAQAATAEDAVDEDAQMMRALAEQHRADQTALESSSSEFFSGAGGPCDRLSDDAKPTCSSVHRSVIHSCSALYGTGHSTCCRLTVNLWKWQQPLFSQLQASKAQLLSLHQELQADALQPSIVKQAKQLQEEVYHTEQRWAASAEHTVVKAVYGSCHASAQSSEKMMLAVTELVNHTRQEPASVRSVDSDVSKDSQDEFKATSLKAKHMIEKAVLNFSTELQASLMQGYKVHKEEHDRQRATQAMNKLNSQLATVADQAAQGFNSTDTVMTEEEHAGRSASMPELFRAAFDAAAKLSYLKGLARLPGIEGSAAVTQREESLAKLSASMHKSLAEYISQSRIKAITLDAVSVSEGQALSTAQKAAATLRALQQRLEMPPISDSSLPAIKNEILSNSVKIERLAQAADVRIAQAHTRQRAADKARDELSSKRSKLTAVIDRASGVKDKFSSRIRQVQEASKRVTKVIKALESAGQTMGTANDAHLSFKEEIQKLQNSLKPPEAPFEK